jgi:hypothetical protein
MQNKIKKINKHTLCSSREHHHEILLVQQCRYLPLALIDHIASRGLQTAEIMFFGISFCMAVISSLTKSTAANNQHFITISNCHMVLKT